MYINTYKYTTHFLVKEKEKSERNTHYKHKPTYVHKCVY